jgi:hypothetical protein
MKKHEFNKQWQSFDKMLEELTPIHTISQIACVSAEVEKKLKWQWIFGIIGIIVAFICVSIEEATGIDPELVWSIIIAVVVLVLAIPALIKGIRAIDDILIKSGTTIYVLKGVRYNKKSGKDFDVDAVYEFNEGELHEYYYFGKYMEKLSFFAPFHIKLKDRDKNKLECTQAKGKKAIKLMNGQLQHNNVKLKDFSI